MTIAGGATNRPALTYRPARAEELAACAGIWKVAIDDYIGRLGQSPMPDETAGLLRLYTHLLATDPERFVVGLDGERIVAFAAAYLRERLWFLSMCFVLPEYQGAGVGRVLLDRVAPPDGRFDGVDYVRGTATDSAQPISNALYASLGIVPRVPLFDFIGLPRDASTFGELPSGVRPVPFDEIAAGPPGGDGHRLLVAEVDALDRELLGVAHPVDHRFFRLQERRGFLYVGPDGSPLGYGYAGEVGRVGPIAVRDAALLSPVIGHLTSAVQARGAYAMWLPGTAGQAFTAALRAGFRMEPMPILLCWDADFADLDRYLPNSPGLL